jgi:hypothetical protein
MQVKLTKDNKFTYLKDLQSRIDLAVQLEDSVMLMQLLEESKRKSYKFRAEQKYEEIVGKFE